jgi:1-deoxy-D-xylulose-5-phosphate synthase
VLADGHRVVVTLEDGQLEGGWGEKVTAFYANSTNPKAAGVRVLNFGATKEFTDRVPLAELDERYGLTVDAVIGRIRRILSH